jgi:hypothetical protein
MNFYTVLKYALLVAFAIILGGAVYLAQDDSPGSQQPVPQPSGQSKFNI